MSGTLKGHCQKASRLSAAHLSTIKSHSERGHGELHCMGWIGVQSQMDEAQPSFC